MPIDWNDTELGLHSANFLDSLAEALERFLKERQ